MAKEWGKGKRIIVIIIFYIWDIVSAAILFKVPTTLGNRRAKLFAIFIINSTAVSAGLTYSLFAANVVVAGYTKKTVAGAIYFTAYCLENIFGPQTFLRHEAPTYWMGIIVVLVSLTIVEITIIALYFIYKAENSKRDREMEGVQLSADEDLMNAFSDLTDKKIKAVRYKM